MICKKDRVSFTYGCKKDRVSFTYGDWESKTIRYQYSGGWVAFDRI